MRQAERKTGLEVGRRCTVVESDIPMVICPRCSGAVDVVNVPTTRAGYTEMLVFCKDVCGVVFTAICKDGAR